MNSQSQQNTTNQIAESDVNEDSLPTNGIHGFMMRHMGHQAETHFSINRTRTIPIIPVLLLIMVALHIVMAIFLARTGSTGFSFNNPMTYGMVGLLVVFAISKLKHIWSFIRRKGKQ